MAGGRRRRHIAAEVSLLSRTSTAALLFLGIAFYGIGDTTGRNIPVEPINSSTADVLNHSHTYNTSLTTDPPVTLPTTTHTHGDTTLLHKVTVPVTGQTSGDTLPTSVPQKVTTLRHLSPTDDSSVGVPTQALQPRERQFLELTTERLHDMELEENVTGYNTANNTDHGDHGSKLDNKIHGQMMTTIVRAQTTTVRTVSSTAAVRHHVTTSRKYLTKTVTRSRVHSVAVTTAVPPQPTGYEDYFMPVDQEDWEAYSEEDHEEEPEDNNDKKTEDKTKAENMNNKANSIQESDIFSMREDGFGPISDIKASQIEVKGPLLSHSFLAENSMGLLVIYTWVVMVTVIAIVTMVIMKHKQQLVDALWERRFKTARTRHVDDAYEEEHNLLPYPQV